MHASRCCSLTSYSLKYPALKLELLRTFSDFMARLLQGGEAIPEASAPAVFNAICIFHTQLDSRSIQDFLLAAVQYVSCKKGPVVSASLQGLTVIL